MYLFSSNRAKSATLAPERKPAKQPQTGTTTSQPIKQEPVKQEPVEQEIVKKEPGPEPGPSEFPKRVKTEDTEPPVWGKLPEKLEDTPPRPMQELIEETEEADEQLVFPEPGHEDDCSPDSPANCSHMQWFEHYNPSWRGSAILPDSALGRAIDGGLVYIADNGDILPCVKEEGSATGAEPKEEGNDDDDGDKMMDVDVKKEEPEPDQEEGGVAIKEEDSHEKHSEPESDSDSDTSSESSSDSDLDSDSDSGSDADSDSDSNTESTSDSSSSSSDSDEEMPDSEGEEEFGDGIKPLDVSLKNFAEAIQNTSAQIMTALAQMNYMIAVKDELLDRKDRELRIARRTAAEVALHRHKRRAVWRRGVDGDGRSYLYKV
ncbi:uncharacterized protein K452DRAFT_287834 [Aplosporella prunicola CBS 121167]|uniref:Uncharacterized protein n=1 Tax=Aplosporella prunicola CBS 121167 TaxID=1176127 RepID=A0A6A6BH26_9PEZI|nr:uncharacterized protein K452DRAFT_287834 [Aplosporella prunicola CBS 121167]KAF2141861.1 hypothetical protein K452DRAFT_287834 [Aplosporella prunicola CBS 121167]